MEASTKRSKKNKTQIQTQLNDMDSVCIQDRQMITMIDYISYSNLIDVVPGSLRCYWDHHSIDTIPLGIPILYFPSQIEHSYFSYQVEKLYSLHKMTSDNENNILDEKSTDLLEDKMSTIIKQHSSFYLTNGIVCSFECMASYINMQYNNPLYEHSKEYMYHMYYTIHSKSPIQKINLAPSWTLLKPYGGSLTIEQFRSGSNSIGYLCLHEYKFNFPICKTMGMIYNEQFLL